jgi:hypothetical protein
MKKLITTFFIFVLLCSVAMAQGQGVHEPGTGIENPEVKEAGQGTGQGMGDGEPQMIMAQEQTQDGEGEQVQARNKEMLQTGLENALSRVKNENAKQRLQQNIEKFQQKYQERMQRMEDVEVGEVDEETGAVQVRAKEQVKYFGFIKGRATKRFNINAQGAIEEKAPWYRFMYAEVEESEE